MENFTKEEVEKRQGDLLLGCGMFGIAIAGAYMLGKRDGRKEASGRLRLYLEGVMVGLSKDEDEE